jgi:cytochrome P450
MTANLPAIVAAVAGVTMLVGVLWASRHAARRRDTRSGDEARLVQRAARLGRLEDLSGIDVLLHDQPVHPECRQLYKAGFRSRVHRTCLDQLNREER